MVRPTMFVRLRSWFSYWKPADVVARNAFDAGVYVCTALPTRFNRRSDPFPNTTVPGKPSWGSYWRSAGDRMSLRWEKKSMPPMRLNVANGFEGANGLNGYTPFTGRRSMMLGVVG